MSPVSYIDLFSGIGGFALALRGIATPVLFCDTIDANSQDVLRKNMAKGVLPNAPIFDDIRDLRPCLKKSKFRKITMVAASPPCIGFSMFGKHMYYNDPQSGLTMEF